jgi:hypothetical protein
MRLVIANCAEITGKAEAVSTDENRASTRRGIDGLGILLRMSDCRCLLGKLLQLGQESLAIIRT